jgi:hypothetical protein
LNFHAELLKEHSQKIDELAKGISELKYLPKLLGEHGQKIDKITEDIHQIGLKQTEILATLDLEKGVSALESEKTRTPLVMTERDKEILEENWQKQLKRLRTTKL